MFGTTSEGALSQAHILLVLAIIWLIMALITKKKRTFTIIVYAGIGTLFELFGAYSIWMSLSGFSLTRAGSYIVAVFLFLLYITLIAVVWIRYQDSRPSASHKYLSISYSEGYNASGQPMMPDYISGYLLEEQDPEEDNCG